MKKKLTYVAKSSIHGKGLFAKKHIGAGELIGVIEGKPATADGDYVLWLDEEQGVRVCCNLRFINHSEEPNAAYYDSLEVCALTDILPGEEITHNYFGS